MVTPARTVSAKTRALLLIFVAAGSAISMASAEEEPTGVTRQTEISEIFRPFQTDRATLAPDGRHLAYELRRDGRLFLVIVNIERNEAVELPLVEDRPIPLSGVSEPVPQHLTYAGWVTSQRLVGTVQDELLFAVDADGRNFKVLLDAPKLEWITQGAIQRGSMLKPRSPILPGYDVSSSNFSDANAPRGVVLEQQQRELEWTLQVDPAAAYSTDPDEFGPVDPRALSVHTDLGSPVQSSLFNTSSAGGAVPSWRPYVVNLLDDMREEVLVEVRGRASPWDDGPHLGEMPSVNAHNVITGLCRINVHTGKIRWSDGDYALSRWLADAEGRPRLRLSHFSTKRTFRVQAKAGGRDRELDKLVEGSGLPPSEVTPRNFFEPRLVPLGFGYDPNLLYYASNQGRDTYGLYALNLETGRPTDLAIEHDALDLIDPNEAIPESVLVFDRYRRELVGVRLEGVRPQTLWLDPQLAGWQQSLNALAPGLDFRMLEWTKDRSRVLVLAANMSQPGAYYLFEPGGGSLREYVQRAPWIEATHTTTPFVIPNPAGGVLRGYFTYPRNTRIEPVPVIVYCHDGPWSRDRPVYDRGVQALASMGFSVLQVNYRGSTGFGRAHLEALRQDEGVAVTDLLTALDWLQQTHAVSQKRVAVMGNGYGGYLALRAVQLHPDRFRCAVGINAPADLPRWLNFPHRPMAFARDVRAAFFQWDEQTLREGSLTHQADAFRRPILLVHAEGDTVVPESESRALRRALSGNAHVKPEVFTLVAEGHSRWLPGTSVRVFERLEEFFRENIFEFTVETGDTSVIEQEEPL